MHGEWRSHTEAGQVLQAVTEFEGTAVESLHRTGQRQLLQGLVVVERTAPYVDEALVQLHVGEARARREGSAVDVLHSGGHDDLAQVCTLLEGMAIGQAGLSVEADVGQLVALVAGVGRDGLQRGGELHRPQARLSVNITAQLRHALGDDGLSQVVAAIECGLANLLHRGGQHDGVQVIVLAEGVVGQRLQVVGQLDVAQVVVGTELPVNKAGIEYLAHVYFNKPGAAVAQGDEVGIVQLSLDLQALQVDKVEVVAQLAEDFVAEGAGLLYGDVKHLVTLAIILLLKGDEAVEGGIVALGAED